MKVKRTIYKYEISPKMDLVIPAGSKILSVHSQGESIFLWTLVDTTVKEVETRKIRVFGTGHAISDGIDLNFLGTAFLPSGLVFHVFEEIGK